MHRHNSKCENSRPDGKILYKCKFKRNGFPLNDITTVEVSGSGYVRDMRVMPRRDQPFLNATSDMYYFFLISFLVFFLSPFFSSPNFFRLLISWRGNSDTSLISNSFGAAVYCSWYSSKSEAASIDYYEKLSLVLSKLPDGSDLKSKLTAVANASLVCRQVSACEALWILLDFPYVEKTRDIVYLILSKKREKIFSIDDLSKMKTESVLGKEPRLIRAYEMRHPFLKGSNLFSLLFLFSVLISIFFFFAFTYKLDYSLRFILENFRLSKTMKRPGNKIFDPRWNGYSFETAPNHFDRYLYSQSCFPSFGFCAFRRLVFSYMAFTNSLVESNYSMRVVFRIMR